MSLKLESAEVKIASGLAAMGRYSLTTDLITLLSVRSVPGTDIENTMLKD